MGFNASTAPFIVRLAATALPASPTYDTVASATPINVYGAAEVELFCDYIRGATGGAFQLQVWGSKDGINYYLRTILDGTSLTAGAVKGYGLTIQAPAAPLGTVQQVSFVLDARRVNWLKVIAGEYGATGTPGTLALATAAD